MLYVEQWQRDLEKKYEWCKKGKTYRTKYFGALKELYGEAVHGKDSSIEESIAQGSTGTDSVCSVVKKAGI